jgi:hypothetical protein
MERDKAQAGTPPRKARLASALRENLKRRKAQARGRASGGGAQDAAPDTGEPQPPSPERGDLEPDGA